MTDQDNLVYLLRSISTRKIERALRKDGFRLYRKTKHGARIYYNDTDGRMAVVHYHGGGQTFTRKTLGSILEGTRWTEADLKRLDLLK